jgi:hypothetical protein
MGWYQPFLILGASLGTIGAGLIYTLNIGSSSSKYIGYQVVAGIGIGVCIQVPVIVAQATCAMADLSIAMSCILCMSARGFEILSNQTSLPNAWWGYRSISCPKHLR